MNIGSDKRKQTIDLIFVLGLLCVFAISALAVVQIGSSSYEKTVESMESLYTGRTATAYIEKQVRQNDQSGAISVEEFEGETALALRSEIGGEAYIRLIYFNDGYLKEIFAKENTNFSLEAGESMIPLEKFKIEQREDNMFAFTVVDNNGAETTTILSTRSQSE